MMAMGNGTRGQGALSALLVTFSVCFAAGCGQGAKGGCPALDSCGGNPAGTWTVSDVCQFQPVRPAQPISTNDFQNMNPPLPPTLAPPQPQPVLQAQSTSGDWCSSLVVTPSGSVMNAMLWHDAPKLIDGTLLFIDNSYVTKLTFSTKDFPPERNTTHFAPRCLMANGGNPTCQQLTTGLTDFYKALKVSISVPETYQNISCAPSAADGGCDCTYIYVLQVDDAGDYLVRDDGTMLQDSHIFTFNGAEAFSQSPARTFETTMCATPGVSLQLSGPNGGSLAGLQGLRTLTLVPKSM
jgi:hypothetical protein